jgi:hypothetical protein
MLQGLKNHNHFIRNMQPICPASGILEFCHFYKVHRKDAELAEVFYYKKVFYLLALRLCVRPKAVVHFSQFQSSFLLVLTPAFFHKF